ncbi:MAG TPA: hypothetical protein VK420_21520, partial [Longimicrobium sp.]|nr:hypothetical protein [Longimicrobium sp.]
MSLLVLTGAASALASDASPRVEVSPAVHHDSTPPLWLMPRALAPEEDADEEKFEAKFDHELRKVPKRPAPAGLNRPDPVRQSYRPYPAMPAVMATFDGVGQGFTGPQGSYSVRSVPPDTTGDVGPNHYVQTVNTGFAVFNKSGIALYGPANTNTIWAGFGGQCASTNRGDAVVLYDQLVDRWFITQFAFAINGAGDPVAPFLQCVAVSQSGDPTGSWHRYSFQYSVFPDYGKFSVWPDAYYATFMGFNGTTFSFAGAVVCAYDRTKMLLGEPATQQCVTLPAFGGL